MGTSVHYHTKWMLDTSLRKTGVKLKYENIQGGIYITVNVC